MRRTILFLLLAAAVASADPLRITEVVTDPQGDHSENAGGNGQPFDGIPGTGTVSSVDEFVEIFNAGPLPLDLRGYRLEFLDTTPASYVFGVSGSGILRFSEGSSLSLFAAGGFALLGNPPGALNNRIDVLLLDPMGVELDRFAIGDGGAEGPGDEATARLFDGTAFGEGLFRDRITPLAPSTPAAPVPEPSSLVLLGLSLLAAARAIGRRARSGERRRPRA